MTVRRATASVVVLVEGFLALMDSAFSMLDGDAAGRHATAEIAAEAGLKRVP